MECSLATPTQAPWPAQIEGFLLSLFVNAALPYFVFRAASPHLSAAMTLLLAALPPIIFAVYGMLRHGNADAMSLFVLATLIPIAAMPLFGGTAQQILVRESLASGVVGVLVLLSLLLPRPAMFYMNRSFATGNSPALVQQYNQHWASPIFRHAMRLMTIMWGIVAVGEAGLRTMLVFVMPSATFLAVSQIIQGLAFAGLMAWTLWYGRYVRRYALAEEGMTARASTSHA